MKDTLAQDLPYEKFERFGADTLSEAELLAIILRTGTKEKTATQVAKEVLSKARYPREGLLGLYDVSVEELQQIQGIGKVKAIQLKCLAELSKRISTSSAARDLFFTNPESIANYYMEQMRHLDRECVVLLCLDSKAQLIKESKISNGTVRMALITPREVFVEALYARAANIILLHNHPSGDPTPSKADIAITKAVYRLGQEIDIPLLDHIVIGDRCFVSMREQSLF